MTATLIVVLVMINVVAAWGILSGRAAARSTAVQELRRQTAAQGRTLEAALAMLRGDFTFLARSRPLVGGLRTLSSDDPVERRWSRLDVEGSVLLFLQAHQAVERILVRDVTGRVVVSAARRDGAPVLLAAGEPAEAVPPAGLVRGAWPVGGGASPEGRIEALVRVDPLLEAIAPHLAGQVSIETGGEGAGGPAVATEAGRVVVREPVADPAWDPPIRWTLARTEEEARLIRSVRTLAAWYRTSILLNITVVSLALVMGALAYRQVRRAAALEEQSRQQERVRELERELLHRDRLASIGRLAAGMAHEINNPLEGMANYLMLLDEVARGGDREEAVALIGRVREGLDRAAGITRQVLLFADPGKAPKERLDLRDLVRDTVEFVASNRAYRNIRVDLACGREPLVVVGNATTLGQMLLNLLLNACQWQPDGGDVSVRCEGADGDAVIVVGDRGPGFAPEVLSRVFEPFNSGRGSTGLGLAMCHGIAQDHGGSAHAANRTGGGAVLTVRLPLAADAPSAAPATWHNGGAAS